MVTVNSISYWIGEIGAGISNEVKCELQFTSKLFSRASRMLRGALIVVEMKVSKVR